MYKFAVVSNPTRINDYLLTGGVISRHRTLTGAARAYNRRQNRCRRTNPGCHLDLTVLEMEDPSHGKRVDHDAWTIALASIGAC